MSLRIQVGQVVVQADLEDTIYAPDMVDDMLKRAGQALTVALAAAQALEIPTTFTYEE